MNKNEVAKELCLARINAIYPDYRFENPITDLGEKIADLYNSIYNNLDIDDDQE